MRTRRIVVAAVVVLSLALVGCGLAASALGQRGPVQTLAKNDDMPEGFLGSAHDAATLELAADRDTAALLWDEHVSAELPRRRGKGFREGIYGDLDRVDFDSHVVALWWGSEATCAQAVTDVQFPDSGTVELSTTEEEPASLDMGIPFRMVLAIDRERLPDLSELPVSLVEITDGHRRDAGDVDMIDSAIALSSLSPTDPIEGAMPASASRCSASRCTGVPASECAVSCRSLSGPVSRS